MNRVLCMIILIFLMVLAGCSTNNPLTLEHLLDVFQKEGLQLTKAEENPKNIFQQGINGVKPSFYQLSDGVIHFYIFKSNKERKEGREDFYDRPVEFVEHGAFEIKNVLILYVYEKNQDDEIGKKINDLIQELKK
ncbi:MAG: hypothetical protein ACQEXQ_25950 [Bacillota bacterium]